MRILALIAVLALTFSCTPHPKELQTGIWRGVIDLQGQQLPFTFEVENLRDQIRVFLKNGPEKLTLDEVDITGEDGMPGDR